MVVGGRPAGMHSWPCIVAPGVGTDTGKSISEQLTGGAAPAGDAESPLASRPTQVSNAHISVWSSRMGSTFQDQRPEEGPKVSRCASI
jgi:hypothetical protein